MARSCSICTHSARAGIDRALVGGESFRGIARTYRVSEDAIARHRAQHLPERLAKAEAASEAAEATDLLREVAALRSKAYGLLLRAEREGDIRTALAGVREARSCLELLAELQGELDRRPVVNLVVSAEWLTVRAAMIAALAPYPEARRGVAERLVALEAGDGDR